MDSRRNGSSVAYFAMFDASRGQGISRKIAGFLQAAASDGWAVRSVVINKPGGVSHLRLGLAIASAEEDTLVVRSTGHHLVAILPFCLLARFRRRLLLDVPTPHGAAFREILRGRLPVGAKVRMALLLAVTGPVGFWAFHRVIQYSTERPWWMLGNRGRTTVMGNGIDLENVPPRDHAPPWPAETLKLVAVANVSFWHGYDRLIRAMRKLGDAGAGGRRVELTIVGGGEAIAELRSLVDELGLTSSVRFLGPREGADLMRIYTEHHVAVGSLALHRKGLSVASELKAREYCAVGITFIGSGRDPDFPEDCGFRYTVSASESVDELVALLEQLLDRRTFPAPESIRRYAAERLDMRLKVREMIGSPDGRILT